MSSTIQMLQFGRTLTDRPYGKSIAKKLLREYEFPATLDFKGVISMGSSFGDEIIAAVSSKQDKLIRVQNTNGAIQSCLEKVGADLKVTIEF